MITTLSVLSMPEFFSLRFNSATRIEELALGMIAKAGESPFAVGILILVLLVGILLLVFAHRVQKWAVKCHKEQERLNVLFEDQMFLLGRYYEDLVGIKGTLSELKETLRRGGASQSPADSISPPAEAPAADSACLEVLGAEPSVRTPAGNGREKDRSHGQRVSQGKGLVEERLKKLAQESNIEISEIGWYKKPGILSTYPYILMVSIGGKPKEVTISASWLGMPSLDR